MKLTNEQIKYKEKNFGITFTSFKCIQELDNNIQIWMFDKVINTIPRFHMMKSDMSINIEISLIDWSIVGDKSWDDFKEFHDELIKYISVDNNKKLLYTNWDATNYYSTIEDYVKIKQIKNIENTLIEYFNFSKSILETHKIIVNNNENENCIPHCHIITNDGFINIEVSLIDFNIIKCIEPTINDCTWDEFRDLKRKFFYWLNKESENIEGCTNKEELQIYWDWGNDTNTLLKHINYENKGTN